VSNASDKTLKSISTAELSSGSPNSGVRLRFAPSPTGSLHIGGARTALFNYLFARKLGGRLILRIDDTDLERSKTEYEKEIIESLTWLGLDWDEGPGRASDGEKYRQSERRSRHVEVGEQLISCGAAHRDSDGAVRLAYSAGAIVVDDIVCGRCEFPANSLGPEPVILKSDGSPTYHLASVADDIDMGITHVIRGQDHLTNTAKHKLIFEALGKPVPAFAHLPLILGEDGTKLSKRKSSDLISVADFRSGGYLPEALINFLVLLGWSHPEAKEFLTLDQAQEVFELERVSRTAAVFDRRRLDHLNGHWIRSLPQERLAEAALPFCGEYRTTVERKGDGFIQAIAPIMQGEISSLSQVESFVASILKAEISIDPAVRAEFEPHSAETLLVISTWRDLLSQAATEDGNDCYSREQFQQLVSRLKKGLEIPQKLMFQSLRLAVFGRPTGPELKLLIPFIRREILLARAEQVLANW
jgi:nondiscriminating glutamyl-tRNA synthetase